MNYRADPYIPHRGGKGGDEWGKGKERKKRLASTWCPPSGFNHEGVLHDQGLRQYQQFVPEHPADESVTVEGIFCLL